MALINGNMYPYSPLGNAVLAVTVGLAFILVLASIVRGVISGSGAREHRRAMRKKYGKAR